MPGPLKTVYIEFVGKFDRLLSGMKKADKATTRVSSSAKQLAAQWKALRRLGITLGAIFGARKLIHGFLTTVKATDQLIQTARNTGIAVDQYNKLSFAFERAGIRADSMRIAILDLQKRLGQKSFDKFYRQAGLDPNELRALSSTDPAKLLQKVAFAVGSFKTQAERIGAAGRLFEEQSGKDIVKLLEGGREEFEKNLEVAAKYSEELNNPENVKALRRASYETLRFRFQWDSIKRKVVIGTLPALTRVIDQLDKNGSLEKMGDDLVYIVSGIADVIKGMIELRATIKESDFAKAFGGFGGQAGTHVSGTESLPGETPQMTAQRLSQQQQWPRTAKRIEQEMRAKAAPKMLLPGTEKQWMIEQNFYGARDDKALARQSGYAVSRAIDQAQLRQSK